METAIVIISPGFNKDIRTSRTYRAVARLPINFATFAATLTFALIVNAGLLLSPVGVSHAQSSADKPAAETLLELMETDNLLARSIEQMLQLQIQQNPSIAPFESIMLEFLNKHMSYEQLKPELVKMYTDAFTDPEIQELIAFYRTPIGEKTIRLMPELMSQGAQMGAMRVQENIAELEENIQAEVERLEESETK